MTASDIEGWAEPGYGAIVDAFHAAFDGPPMGAALAVRHDGRLVVDVWGGDSDTRVGRRWEENTETVIFSCTKGLMSILAARLVADGRLDYDAPVSHYWPEFAQAGKETVLVRHLLSHQAGLSAPRPTVTLEQAVDWNHMTTLLAEQEPLWEPGTAHLYHPITHGWLVGEVVQRAAGVPLRKWFARELAEPLHAQVHLGVAPEDGLDIAHLTVGDTLANLIETQAAARVPGEIDWPDRAMTLGSAFPPALAGPDEGFNLRDVQAAIIPGAGGIASARGLASVWSATVVETDGVRLLDDETRLRSTAVQSEGEQLFGVPGPYARWGMGFQLDSEARRYLGPQSLGHDGAGGQCAFADADEKIGFAFVTNRMEAGDDRATRIIDALRVAIGTRSSLVG